MSLSFTKKEALQKPTQLTVCVCDAVLKTRSGRAAQPFSELNIPPPKKKFSIVAFDDGV
jgi:hypothetical protein